MNDMNDGQFPPVPADDENGEKTPVPPTDDMVPNHATTDGFPPSGGHMR